MIEEVIMYALECDNCKEPYEESYQGYSAFHDAASAEEKAENDGWFTDETESNRKHYCPSCWDTNDEDELIIKDLTPANN